MSLLFYNGVTLPYGMTNDFSQQAVYDEQGHTDRVYTRYEITYQGLFNADYLNTIAPTLQLPANSTNPADIMNAVRATLLRPRMAFSFTVNGTNLIPALTGPGTVDAKNGPQPEYCKVMELNSTTFIVTYRIVAHYWEGQGFTSIGAGGGTSLSTGGQATAPTGNTVLDNRWTETVEIDNCNYTSRTRDGVVLIRSDNSQGQIADMVRSQMAVCGVPAGFLRVSSRYTVDPSGLALRYTITDAECFKKPPSPAFEADGEYIEEATEMGALTYGEVRVRLKGSKTTDQAKLVQTAVFVGQQKIRTRGNALIGAGGTTLYPTPPGATTGLPGIPEWAKLQVDLYRNEVEFRMRCMFVPPAASRLGALSAFVTGQGEINTKYLCDTPLSPENSPYNPGYLDRGTAGFLLRAAAYYDPSLANVTLVSTAKGAAPNPATRVNTGGDQFSNNLIEVGKAGTQQEKGG